MRCGRCCGLNVCVLPELRSRKPDPQVMAVGGGAFGE